MSIEPRIYTMPEAFLKDSSVPARWRLLAVMNGFFLNGLPFYGSNAWLMEKLGCVESTVTMAVKELEELGEISCNRTRRSRIIKRRISETPVNLGLRPQSIMVSDPDQSGTNSVSNSVNLIPSEIGISQVLEVAEEKEKRPKKKAEYPHAPEVFSWFPKPEKSWYINTTILKHSELLYTRGEKAVRQALEWIEENKGHDEFFPQVLNPTDLERKWRAILAYKKKHGL